MRQLKTAVDVRSHSVRVRLCRRRSKNGSIAVSRAGKGALEQIRGGREVLSKGNRDFLHAAALDELIEQLTLGSSGEAEQIWAFPPAFEAEHCVPFQAFVIGEPVSVISFNYYGNARRGLSARFLSADGSDSVLAACEIATPSGTQSERNLAAYRPAGWDFRRSGARSSKPAPQAPVPPR